MKTDSLLIMVTTLCLIFVIIFKWYKTKVYVEDPVAKYFEEKPPQPVKIERVW